MDLKSKYFGILLVLYFQHAEACLKKPDDGSGSNTGQPVSTQSPTSTESLCTEAERAAKGCLNGGECVVKELWGNRQTQCNCPKDYEGSRCESRTGLLHGDPSGMLGSSIAGIVVGIVVLLALIGGIVFLVIRKRKKDGRPKLDEPSYAEEIPEKNSKPSNYAASRHFYNSNQRTFSNFGFSSDVSSDPKPPPYSVSGNSSAPGKRSGTIAADSDEKDAHSSRPPSSSGGSVFHTSGSLGPIKVPLAFHETGV